MENVNPEDENFWPNPIILNQVKTLRTSDKLALLPVFQYPTNLLKPVTASIWNTQFCISTLPVLQLKSSYIFDAKTILIGIISHYLEKAWSSPLLSFGWLVARTEDAIFKFQFDWVFGLTYLVFEIIYLQLRST